MTTLNELRSQADEIAAAGHAGWGNTMRDAADEIDRLRTEAVAADIRIANDSAAIAGLTAERDELRKSLADRDAKLAALEKQEPVDAIAVDDMSDGYDKRYGRVLVATENCIKPLYAAAGAAPVPTDAEIEALAVKHEAFGFGRVDAKGITTHGFDPDGLHAFVKELLPAAPKEPT